MIVTAYNNEDIWKYIKSGMYKNLKNVKSAIPNNKKRKGRNYECAHSKKKTKLPY